MLPGLANAEFLRLGQIHRNTFLDSPRVLGRDLSLKAAPHLFFAGQITGVEGYVESTACGYLAALGVLARLAGRDFRPPPPETAIGALYGHLTGAACGDPFQPSNVTFGLFPPLEGVRKSERRAKVLERAAQALDGWMADPEGPCARLARP
jgi:methylenetetrahydrofolate--tRNA-(uracil-5-)-methyltransferase